MFYYKIIQYGNESYPGFCLGLSLCLSPIDKLGSSSALICSSPAIISKSKSKMIFFIK